MEDADQSIFSNSFSGAIPHEPVPGQSWVRNIIYIYAGEKALLKKGNK
jgi:hypothetical protein